MTTASTLTTDLISAAYDDERWLGWGYLGERAREVETGDAGRKLVAKTDQLVIDLAAEAGWDAETLFHWLNSKHGRWLADEVFGGGSWTRDQLRQRYFAKVDFLP